MNNQINYSLGENQTADDYPTLEEKIEQTRQVVRTGLTEYENPAVMWTGGKDSTVVLYFVKEIAEELDIEKPPVVFIDHGQHFDIVEEFVDTWSEKWGFEVITARNDDVISNAGEPASTVSVSDLNKENQYEIREKLEYDEATFPFALNTEVGNHLLKTVALNSTLTEHGFDAIFSGIRWDEQDSRAEETFFSPRQDSAKYPPHDRVHPILQYLEADIWAVLWTHIVPRVVPTYPDNYIPESEARLPGVSMADIPICQLYFKGYRSLGSETETVKSADEPAWVQDMENTVERAGRAQDKEGVMERLRDLGYM